MSSSSCLLLQVAFTNCFGKYFCHTSYFMQTANRLYRGLQSVWIECFRTKNKKWQYCTNGITAHNNSYTLSGRFRCCFAAPSKKKIQCTLGRPHFWIETTHKYADMLPNNLWSTLYIIITRKCIINTLTSRFGLSGGTCPGSSALLISGRFGLLVIVTKEVWTNYFI